MASMDEHEAEAMAKRMSSENLAQALLNMQNEFIRQEKEARAAWQALCSKGTTDECIGIVARCYGCGIYFCQTHQRLHDNNIF